MEERRKLLLSGKLPPKEDYKALMLASKTRGEALLFFISRLRRELSGHEKMAHGNLSNRVFRSHEEIDIDEIASREFDMHPYDPTEKEHAFLVHTHSIFGDVAVADAKGAMRRFINPVRALLRPPASSEGLLTQYINRGGCARLVLATAFLFRAEKEFGVDASDVVQMWSRGKYASLEGAARSKAKKCAYLEGSGIVPVSSRCLVQYFAC